MTKGLRGKKQRIEGLRQIYKDVNLELNVNAVFSVTQKAANLDLKI